MSRRSGFLLKVLLYAFLLALLCVGTAAVWLLLLDGRAPARRPDLVRLPDDAPPAPSGYPTPNALYLAFALGRVHLIDHKGEVPLPGGVVEEKDITIGQAGDRPLQLDLYRPAEAAGDPVPGLVFIHGGGWKGGDRSDYKVYTVRFAEAGYVVATVSYRFSQEAPFPAAVEDVKCAVRWMRAHAGELGVDPDRIAAIGGSAGGHLAMMLGYAPDEAELEGTGGNPGVSSAVQAVVNLYGPCDLTAPEARDNPLVTNFIGQSFAEAEGQYRLASPLHHLAAGAPPTFIIHGTIDDIVPVTQSDALAERLKALGVPHWYDRLDGWPHTLDLEAGNNARTFALIRAFLEARLGGPPTG